MGYNELEVELRKVEDQIARWRTWGYLPAIEQGLALRRLQRIYAELVEMPCGDPAEAGMAGETAPADEQPEGVAVEPAAIGPEERETEETAEIIAEGAYEETEGGMAEETHVRQDDEAHDLCPPQLEFPEAEFHPEPEQELEAAEEVLPETETEPETESSAVPEAEIEPEPEIAEEVQPEAEIDPEPEPAPEKPEPQQPEPPRILGIEVSPYARHEIIDTLFRGNEALFESETAKLDAMDSLEEALVYVGENYRWIPENAATIKFIDLLESRFER